MRTALEQVLAALGTVEGWLDQHMAVPETARAAVVVTVREQDVEVLPGDGEMRHGRKSRSQRFDGYKRHVLRDLDTGLVRAVGITPANAPEASVLNAAVADLRRQEGHLHELHIDRGYLASAFVRDRPADLSISCKAWPVHNGDRYPKTAFVLDWSTGTIRCPNTVVIPFHPSATVQFPEQHGHVCPLRQRCTTSVTGRSVHIHRDERLLQELRERQLTPLGRARLRERLPVEHALSYIGRWQGLRARYRGPRKNLFDLRRCAVVLNLHVLFHSDTRAAA